MWYNNNWKIETDYGNRAQLVYYDDFYGKIDMGPLQVISHNGINNNFVTSTLGGSVGVLSGTPAYYAS